MKKILLAWILSAALLLTSCTAAPSGASAGEAAEETAATPTEAETAAPDGMLSAIDHSVVEPDELAAMTDGEAAAYRALTDALLAREESVTLDADAERVEFLLELLHESPYYFFAESVDAQGTQVTFRYAYTAQEQQEMQELMDSALLSIVNCDAAPDDNELDTILKIYSAVTHRIEYDLEREDNKELGSPLFDYPADEVYKALRDGKALCYGFAFVMRYALLQRGIDAFCVYGECRSHEQGHEWVVFRLGDRYYHCDPAWDRASDNNVKLIHFGKTDDERTADTLYPRDFAEYHEAVYPAFVCDDERFGIFRNVVSFSYTGGHCFYIEDRDGNGAVFDTESFTVAEA